nr:hypothetical protein [Desulfobulbaceae bacterium]
MEPQIKVLVSEEFLATAHGEIGCVGCHGGNDTMEGKDEAHQGMAPTPAITNPVKTCGECHEEIVSTASKSLHATLSTFPTVLLSRADPTKWPEIDEARSNHCAACHTNSCGACHVSRPKASKKGFVKGHIFQKRSDPVNQCTACHGSRVGSEFYGMRGQGDVHATKGNMDCVTCHDGQEMHADGTGLSGRYHLEELVHCEECHADLQYGSVRDHTIHIGKVQCQVCHSQTYVSCYSCHTGRDEAGLYYFQNKKEVEGMKIGMNYDQTAPNAKYDYMLVRHIPVDPKLFDFYVKDALSNFSRVPNWKRTSPHNIQRKTWQNANCNNCHGNTDLFLQEKDLLDYEIKANRSVVVPAERIPGKIEKTAPFSIDTSKVNKAMVVDSRELHDLIEKKAALIVDARSSKDYAKGHIEGSISFSPLEMSLRQKFDSDEPLQLVSFDQIAEMLGQAGIKSDQKIVVYDKDGRLAGFLLWVLQYAGATDVAYLKGGIESWHEAGYHTSEKETPVSALKFGGKEMPRYVATNDFVLENLDNPATVIVDVRIVTQAKGMLKHDAAERAGHIPGSVNLPLSALYMDNAELKEPAELLWMLNNYGITPDKTVITTCNTGQLAGAAFSIFRYLGFENVKTHDSSWINWELGE